MVKIMNYEFRIMNLLKWLVIVITSAFIIHNSEFLFSQQPQSQPVFSVNAKAVQGVGPGNWTYGADVNLYVSTTGNDSTGNGASGNPYLTIARALQDVPLFVSQHYIINLASGTYREQVNVSGRYFGTNTSTNLNQASIEIKGNPTAPASYVISGANASAPTIPVRAAGVVCSFANCILNGVSIQYSTTYGFHQSGGLSVINSSDFSNLTTANARGVWIDSQARSLWGGASTLTNDSYGIAVYDQSIVSTSDFNYLNPGFTPAAQAVTISGILANGTAVQVFDHSWVDFEGTINFSGAATGFAGLDVEAASYFGNETGTISGFSYCVFASGLSFVEINSPTFTNCTTAVHGDEGAHFGSAFSNPVFTGVTTQYQLIQSSTASNSKATNTSYFPVPIFGASSLPPTAAAYYGSSPFTSNLFAGVFADARSQGYSEVDILSRPSGNYTASVLTQGYVDSGGTAQEIATFGSEHNNPANPADTASMDAWIEVGPRNVQLKVVGTNGTGNGSVGIGGAMGGGTSLTGAALAALGNGNVGIGTASVASGQKLEVNGGIALNTATAKPVCSATTRGTFWVTQNATLIKDAVEVCAKDNVDVYAWRTIY